MCEVRACWSKRAVFHAFYLKRGFFENNRALGIYGVSKLNFIRGGNKKTQVATSNNLGGQKQTTSSEQGKPLLCFLSNTSKNQVGMLRVVRKY